MQNTLWRKNQSSYQPPSSAIKKTEMCMHFNEMDGIEFTPLLSTNALFYHVFSDWKKSHVRLHVVFRTVRSATFRILLYWYEIVIHYFETKFQNIVAVQKQLISEREAYSKSRKNSKKKSGDWINKSRMLYNVVCVNEKRTSTYSFLTDCKRDRVEWKFFSKKASMTTSIEFTHQPHRYYHVTL